MPDRDKDRDETLEPNEFEPGEDEFEEAPEEGLALSGEPEGGFEGEGEPEEPRGREDRREAGAPSWRRFGFGRGRQGAEEAAPRPTGSVRESHERVHIDDRPSAIYALFVAVVLIGVLAVALGVDYLPKSVPPSLPPLVVPTGQATASPSAGASVTIAPTASPTAAPSASPTAAPSAT